jgi:hypothetical protein
MFFFGAICSYFCIDLTINFWAMTDATKADSIRHYTCYAHQVNRAAKYALGTGDFVQNNNAELGKVIKKMHKINARVYRSETCLKVLFQVQKDKEWYVKFPCLQSCLVSMYSNHCLASSDLSKESHSMTIQGSSYEMEFRL